MKMNETDSLIILTTLVGQAVRVIGSGTVLEDRYEVIRLLARGGSADVFLATDHALERPVALKVVQLARTDDQARLEPKRD